MTPEDIYCEVLCCIADYDLTSASQRDVLAAVKAARPGPLGFICDAGLEAGLERKPLLMRGAAAFLFFCAGNLSDDLSDGDCDYFDHPDPPRLGPCTQLIVQNLFFEMLTRAGLDRATTIAVLHELNAAVGLQHVELRVSVWTAPLFRQVAEGIAGRQWAGYLQILWSGTRLEARARRIGLLAGIAAHVLIDIESRDRRFEAMPEEDRRAVAAWAREIVDDLAREELHCLAPIQQWAAGSLGHA